MAQDKTKFKESPTALQQYWWYAQRPGDILFTRAKGLSPFANVSAQTIVSRKKARASHVILCVVPGLYAHSVTGEGVVLQKAEDLPIFVTRQEAAAYSRGTFLIKAVRHRELSENLQHAMKIVESSGYFIGQKYNSLFFVKQYISSSEYQKSSSFCSELVAAIFDRLGMPLGLDKPEEILPVSLEELLTEPDWEDVTGVYMAKLSKITNHIDEQPDLGIMDKVLNAHLRKQAGMKLDLIAYQVLNVHAMKQFNEFTSFMMELDTTLDQDLSDQLWNEYNKSVESISKIFQEDLSLNGFSDLYERLFEGIFSVGDRESVHFVQTTHSSYKPSSTRDMVSQVRKVLEKDSHTLTSVRDSLQNAIDNFKSAFPDQMPELPESASGEDLTRSEAFRVMLMMALTAQNENTDETLKGMNDCLQQCFIEFDTFVDQHKNSVKAFSEFVNRLRDTNFLEEHEECADDVDAIIRDLFPRCIEIRCQLFDSSISVDQIEKQVASIRGNKDLLQLVDDLNPNR